MKMGGRQGPRGGQGRDRGALGACGTSLGFRVACGRGRWSSPARRSPWDVEHKARGVLQATGFPYCSGRGLGLRSPTPDGKNGGLVPPVAKGERPGGKGPRSGPRPGQGARSVCLPSARYLQSGLSPSSVGTVRSTPSPPPSRLDGHTIPRGPVGTDERALGFGEIKTWAPVEVFEGQKENALQSRP